MLAALSLPVSMANAVPRCVPSGFLNDDFDLTMLL